MNQLLPILQHVDFFNFFRYVLEVVVGIYATIVTVQSMYTWLVWLGGEDRYISMVRRYLVVHGLRLRFKSFMGDVVICVLLTVVLLLLWRAHYLVGRAGEALQGNDFRTHQSQ